MRGDERCAEAEDDASAGAPPEARGTGEASRLRPAPGVTLNDFSTSMR